MNITDLRTATRLKALGYPQDQWPQMVWQESMEGYTRLAYQIDASEYPVWVAAPHSVDALEWLEQTRRLVLQRDDLSRLWKALPRVSPGWLSAATAADLLTAVLDVLEATNA
jgi:hypothetical protein